MDPFWKDLIDALAKVMGAIGVLVAAWALRNNARTRREDLRWRVANSAHDLLDEIHRHEFAVEAVTMLDSHLAGHSYDAADASLNCRNITLKEISEALTDKHRTPSEKYIYQCFDWFFYYLDRISYLNSEGLLNVNDVAGPLLPYAEVLQKNWASFESLVHDHCYRNVEGFLRKVKASDPRTSNPGRRERPTQK